MMHRLPWRLLPLVFLCSTATASPGARMDRDQLFFVGRAPEPVLLVLIVQRTRERGRVLVETKSFLGWRGRWRAPFWERLTLSRWPGEDLGAVVAAWASARSGAPLRVDFKEAHSAVDISLRRRSGSLRLQGEALRDAGGGLDPHGPVRWRAGPGRLTVNGRTVRGIVVVERLRRARRPWPRFGRFEMWLVAPAEGGLLLGRVKLHGKAGAGRALRVTPDGRALPVPFEVETVRSRRDDETGYPVPLAWRVGLPGWPRLTRTGGELSRGSGPGGAPALYTIALAASPDGAGAALVFHLQDE